MGTKMIEAPYRQEKPSDPIARVQTLALDLAYGASEGHWEPIIYIDEEWMKKDYWYRHPKYNQNLKNLIRQFWQNFPPSPNLLLSFGYIQHIDGISFALTQKAFALLEKPATPPSVFISYKQTESSALALLIESRIKNVDENVSIFIDKNIESGESINSRIEEALEQSRFFICLLGSNTLANSPAVKTEIALAKENPDCVIIPICHNSYIPDDIYKQHFDDKNAIIINPESAEEYEINMTKLLIRLGYSTI
jgi:hypothetical protein